MRFAFASFKYFPYGGLEKDMLRMAECAASRGHEVTILTGKWECSQYPDTPGITVKIIPVSGGSNHARAESFCRNIIPVLKEEKFDCVTAFNRIPGCDFYFAADNCYAVEMPKKHAKWVLKLFPRYRTYLAIEKGVAGIDSDTVIFYITAHQKPDYQKSYGTPEERFILLPPGMNPDCRRKENAIEIRAAKRQELGVADDGFMLLLVGSNFRQKGGDRAITALAGLPENIKAKSKLFFAGADDPSFCQKLAKKLGVEKYLTFLGARKDVPDLLAASDVLLLPARNEATGTVLVEAISAGVPTICSSECGFKNFVQDSGGTVLPEKWSDSAFSDALADTLINRDEKLLHAINYSTQVDFTRRADCAVDAMERFAVKEK